MFKTKAEIDDFVGRIAPPGEFGKSLPGTIIFDDRIKFEEAIEIALYLDADGEILLDEIKKVFGASSVEKALTKNEFNREP